MSADNIAGLGTILDKAVTGYTKGVMSRDEVAVKRAKDKQTLEKMQYEEQTGSMQQQIDVLNQKNKELSNKATKQASFNYIQRYLADGNPRHLNSMFKELPEVAQMAGVSEASLVDPWNPEDQQMIAGIGGTVDQFYMPEAMDDSDDAEIHRNTRRRFLKTRRSDGTWGITDFENVIKGFGYFKQADDAEIKRTMQRLRIKKLQGGGGTATSLNRNATTAAAAKERIAAGKGTAKDEEFVRGWNKELAGTTPGRSDIAAEETDKLVTSFGGEDAFFATDFSDTKNFTKGWRYVHKIMQVGNVKFTTKDRAEIHSIRSLMALGAPGAELTEDETGIMDNVLSNAKKYLFEEVGGVEAKSAYSAFRNATRHALYGAALTEAEINSFNEAFGTLGQKLGPVLQQFKTALLQVKSKLDSIANLNDPYVSKVLLGADQVKMDNMVTALEERIDYVTGAAKKNPAQKSLLDRVRAKRGDK